MQTHHTGKQATAPTSLASRRRRSGATQNTKMKRTIIYILPRQYARYQTKATRMQRHFAELVRGKLAELLNTKDLIRFLRKQSNEVLLNRTDNTVSVQIYIPVSMKSRIERIQLTHGVTQSGLFRVALNLDQIVPARN